MLMQLCIGAIFSLYIIYSIEKVPKDITAMLDDYDDHITINHDIRFPENQPINIKTLAKLCIICITVGICIITKLIFSQYSVEYIIIYNTYFLLLLHISACDFYYKFIDISYCQYIIVLFLFGVYFQVIIFNINQIIYSLSFSIIFLSSLYFLSIIVWNKEALGYGDCLLFNALSIYHKWYELPELLLLASIIGMVYFFISSYTQKNKKTKIPFAVCLSISSILVIIFHIIIK